MEDNEVIVMENDENENKLVSTLSSELEGKSVNELVEGILNVGVSIGASVSGAITDLYKHELDTRIAIEKERIAAESQRLTVMGTTLEELDKHLREMYKPELEGFREAMIKADYDKDREYFGNKYSEILEKIREVQKDRIEGTRTNDDLPQLSEENKPHKRRFWRR